MTARKPLFPFVLSLAVIFLISPTSMTSAQEPSLDAFLEQMEQWSETYGSVLDQPLEPPAPKVLLSDNIPRTMSSAKAYTITFTPPTGFEPPYTIAFEGHGFRFKQIGNQPKGRLYGYAAKMNDPRNYHYTLTDGTGQTDGKKGQTIIKPYFKKAKPPVQQQKASMATASATAVAAADEGGDRETACELARVNTYKNSDGLTKKYRELIDFLDRNNIKYYSKDDYFTELIGPVQDGDLIKVKIRLKEPAKDVQMALYVFGLLQGTMALPYCARYKNSQTLGANGQGFGGRFLRGTLRSKSTVLAETTVGGTPPYFLRGEFRVYDMTCSHYVVVPDSSFPNGDLIDEFTTRMKYLWVHGMFTQGFNE